MKQQTKHVEFQTRFLVYSLLIRSSFIKSTENVLGLFNVHNYTEDKVDEDKMKYRKFQPKMLHNYRLSDPNLSRFQFQFIKSQ